MSEAKHTTYGPRFTRDQVQRRYQTEFDKGETKMDLEAWLLDEVNALESINHSLLEACKTLIESLEDETFIDRVYDIEKQFKRAIAQATN